MLAEVAELVDALDSGSSVRKDVRVQISLSAPFHYHIDLQYYLKINTHHILTI